jgi:hypothetical protein
MSHPGLAEDGHPVVLLDGLQEDPRVGSQQIAVLLEEVADAIDRLVDVHQRRQALRWHGPPVAMGQVFVDVRRHFRHVGPELCPIARRDRWIEMRTAAELVVPGALCDRVSIHAWAVPEAQPPRSRNGGWFARDLVDQPTEARDILVRVGLAAHSDGLSNGIGIAHELPPVRVRESRVLVQHRLNLHPSVPVQVQGDHLGLHLALNPAAPLLDPLATHGASLPLPGN